MVPRSVKSRFGSRLRQLREERGYSQEELAERAGLSARYIGAIERADVSASVTVLGQVAEALEAEAAELVRGPHRKGDSAVSAEPQE